MRYLASLGFVGMSLVAFGCASKGSPNIDTAAGAIDSSNSVESEGNVMMALTDGADVAGVVALTSDQAAARIAANVALRWNPSGCATASASGSNVTVTLNDCTGPRGLVHVSGTLSLVVSIDANGSVVVTGHSDDLMVNKADLTFDVTATYSSSGTTHSLAVQTQGQGTGPLGNNIDHNGNYTISWDTSSQCGSIDGTWSTEFSNGVQTATRSNDVSVMRCAGGCPTGTIVHHFLKGQTLTVTFDGTNVASWVTSGGRSGTVNLTCQ